MSSSLSPVAGARGESADAAVLIEILADVRLQPLQQGSQQLLRLLQLLFESLDSLVQRLGVSTLFLDLIVLDEIPEESHRLK